MNNSPVKWLRTHFNQIFNSIAFIPALIATGFLLLSWGMIELDFSSWGKQLKSGLSWLSLKDASTARVIISTITSGLISLTVFSFSLVMIVLTQAASQMSNRILSSMIENKFQQAILGFYIGSIVYSLFLLSTIRDINSGVYVPALSIYLLIILTIVDIFLFIYFLDYVTRTVKYETVIHRVELQTLESMEKHCCYGQESDFHQVGSIEEKIFTKESGYFQEFATKQLVALMKTEKINILIHRATGDYLLKGSFFATVFSTNALSDNFKNNFWSLVDFYNGQPIDRNPDYGFNQLAEVAIKALSPGINDPATAVLSLNALFNLFSVRLRKDRIAIFRDDENQIRAGIKVKSFEELFQHCIFPILHYGKNDQYIQNTLLSLIEELIVLNGQDFKINVLRQFKMQIQTCIQELLSDNSP